MFGIEMTSRHLFRNSCGAYFGGVWQRLRSEFEIRVAPTAAVLRSTRRRQVIRGVHVMHSYACVT